MATGDPDYISKDPLPQYVPVPFPATYPRGPGTTSPGTGGGTGGGSTENGAVYAAALFVNAACQRTDRVGAWVRAADATSAVVTTTSQLSYPAIGVIVSKTSDTTCVVQTYGLCGGVYSGLTPNLRLFVGPTGQAVPGSQLPSGTAYVQPVGFSVRSDTVFVQPSGTLFRRDATADASDPAPPPSGDGTSSYQPVLHGTGAPQAALGRPGDVYLATDTLTLYQRGDSAWDEGRALAAAAQPGAKGETGEPGSRIYRVATLPADGAGYRAGDILIDDLGNVAQVEST